MNYFKYYSMSVQKIADFRPLKLPYPCLGIADLRPARAQPCPGIADLQLDQLQAQNFGVLALRNCIWPENA
jgi:hypothetical protein